MYRALIFEVRGCLLRAFGGALLAGVLPSRFCIAGFAARAPCWKLPSLGRVVDLVTSDFGRVVGTDSVDAV